MAGRSMGLSLRGFVLAAIKNTQAEAYATNYWLEILHFVLVALWAKVVFE